MRFFFFCVLLVSLSATAQQLDHLKLNDILTNSHVSLASLVKGSKLLVVVSAGTQCPVFGRYIPTIHRISKKFENQGVSFLLINSFPGAKPDGLKKEISDFSIQLPLYIDDQQMFAKSFGIKTLSESVLIDISSAKILYKGAIDNRIKHGLVNSQGIDYLENAITSALKGETITLKETKSDGCIIQFKNSSSHSL